MPKKGNFAGVIWLVMKFFLNFCFGSHFEYGCLKSPQKFVSASLPRDMKLGNTQHLKIV